MGDSEDNKMRVVDLGEEELSGTVEGGKKSLKMKGRSLEECKETVKELVDFLRWKDGEIDC